MRTNRGAIIASRILRLIQAVAEDERVRQRTFSGDPQLMNGYLMKAQAEIQIAQSELAEEIDRQ